MDYKDFVSVWTPPTGYIDLYELDTGDYFMEDTYPDVYQVIAVIEGKEVADGSFGKVVESINLTNKIFQDWFYRTEYSAYAPILIKLEKK